MACAVFKNRKHDVITETPNIEKGITLFMYLMEVRKISESRMRGNCTYGV